MALQKKKSVPMKVNKKAVAPAGAPVSAPKSGEYIVAVGRRKVASARIRLYRGKGQSMVNGKPMHEYFASVDPLNVFTKKPFIVTDTLNQFYAVVKVVGSGLRSQIDASLHGISRALVKADATHKDALRKAGLLTRDSRMKESRKIGTGGKARRQKQSPKR
jgi:small subunit ribosomal protein S9